MKNENSRKPRSVEADIIYQELEDFFCPCRFDDVTFNGLILDNAEKLTAVYTATFSSREVIDVLKKRNVENALLFTHHPGPQRGIGKSCESFTEDDFAFLRERNISHFNYHLPLDHRNPYSPSVSLAKKIGAVPYQNFFEEGGAVMGLFCTGQWKTDAQVLSAVEQAVGHSCKLYSYGGALLQDGKIAISAGGAEGTDIYNEMAEAGVKLFITGVGSKNVDWFAPSHQAAEKQGISILAAGHYSTEKFALIDMCRFFEERGLTAKYIEEIPQLTDL